MYIATTTPTPTPVVRSLRDSGNQASTPSRRAPQIFRFVSSHVLHRTPPSLLICIFPRRPNGIELSVWPMGGKASCWTSADNIRRRLPVIVVKREERDVLNRLGSGFGPFPSVRLHRCDKSRNSPMISWYRHCFLSTRPRDLIHPILP